MRVAVLNDYPLVVAGVQAMLVPYADRLRLVDDDPGVDVRSRADVVLYDTFGTGHRLGHGAGWSGQGTRLVVYTWNTRPHLVREALDAGASGFVSKQVSADELVDALVRVHRGEVVVPTDTEVASVTAKGAWPGMEEGLSPRESEVLALICRGLSNQELADVLYLSVNSVKTYVRTAYRKIGVSSRAQAVLWGVQHGFQPPPAPAPWDAEGPEPVSS